MENQNYIEKRLYELLPDYVFKKLSAEDIEFFEQNYHSFPEIQNEVVEGDKFFKRLESMDFDKVFKEHTRNISVRVQNKRTKKSKFSSFVSVSRIVMPTMGVAAILLLAWNIFFVPADRIIQVNQEQLSKLDEPIFYQINANGSDSDDIEIKILSQIQYTNIHSFASIYESMQGFFDDEYDETLELAYTESPNYFWGFGNQSNLSIINEVSNLSETEFQELLEEISQNEIFNY